MFFLGTLRRIANAILRRGPSDDDDGTLEKQQLLPQQLLPHAVVGAAPKERNRKRQRALLIGNNYPGSSCPLSGCVNDVRDVRDFLVGVKGWAPADVELKTEATKLAIVQGLCGLALASWTQGLDTAYIHYSGHGTQVADANGDEAGDGLDEALCPADYETAGMLTDDFLNLIICTSFNPRTKVRAVFDACHSGSCLDLAYTCEGGKRSSPQLVGAKTEAVRDVQLLSGCRDAQTSADATYGGRPAGALTNSLLRVLRASPGATSLQVLDGVHAMLAAEGAGQFPLLSGSRDPATATATATADAFIP